MSKTLVPTILSILRQYGVAGELSKQRSVTNAKEQQVRPHVNLLSFIFEQSKYYIIFDDTAEDDEQYLRELIAIDKPDATGKFIENPRDERKTYGMPFKGKDVYLFEIVAQKRRLDVELAERYPTLSRSTIQKYIKAGLVKVNGEVVLRPKHDIRNTDQIALAPPENTDYTDSELPIIYIDDSVIVVNKPAGVLTHSKGVMSDEFTVADFFRRYTTNGLETTRPGIVHRLDRETSGVIIGARTDEAATLLKKQFSDRTVKKHYTAVVDGVPKLEEAIIDLPIGRNPSSPSTFRVDAKGKPALTAYKVLKTNGTQSLIELRPKTGRTHQLRVHMQYLNTPIAGDRVYGNVKTAPRMALHAHTLEITIPQSKREVFTAPVPEEFSQLIKE